MSRFSTSKKRSSPVKILVVDDEPDCISIMVTAFCEAQDVVKASSFGISDYIAKPVDFAKLIERISNTLEQKTLSSAKK